MSRLTRLEVPVHYDFASCLCFVAHRVLGRLDRYFEDLEIELVWTPFDLARITGWRPGSPLAGHRLDEIRSIAAALDVDLVLPSRWLDSRRLAAASIALKERDEERDAEGSDRVEPVWRERIFAALYATDEYGVDEPDQGGRPAVDALSDRALTELGVVLDAEALSRGARTLESLTVSAAEAMVTGVPTFMFGPWPIGGIHDEATLRSMFGRFAASRRRLA